METTDAPPKEEQEDASRTHEHAADRSGSRRATASVLGAVLVGWVVVLVSCVLFLHLTTVLPHNAPPRTAPEEESLWARAWRGGWWAVHLGLCLWLFQGGTASYLSAVFTPPGSPEPLHPDRDADLLRRYAHLRHLPPPARGDGFSPWCSSCQQPKLGRTHHCKYCNKCARKRRLCPNALSADRLTHNNHRHFFLFVVYVWISSLYGALSILPLAYDAYYTELDNWSLRVPPSYILVSAFLNLSTVIAVSILLAMQAFLISTGQTSVEWQVNRIQRRKAKQEGRPYRFPHDLGLRRNWELFFGKHSFTFILLPSICAPPPLDESLETHYAGV